MSNNIVHGFSPSADRIEITGCGLHTITGLCIDRQSPLAELRLESPTRRDERTCVSSQHPTKKYGNIRQQTYVCNMYTSRLISTTWYVWLMKWNELALLHPWRNPIQHRWIYQLSDCLLRLLFISVYRVVSLVSGSSISNKHVNHNIFGRYHRATRNTKCTDYN